MKQDYMKVKKKYWKLIQLLSNLQLSIFMLLIIAGISIIGTIIEQNQNLEFYQTNYPIKSNFIYPISWKLIKFIGLDHIFQTWWFIGLLIFFASTIICCTISRQFPILKIAKNIKIYQNFNALKSKRIYEDAKNNTFSNYIVNLLKNQYLTFQSHNQVYACRGIFGRLSPIIVHFSMLFVLLGSSIGFFNGFVSQEMVPKGEFFHIQNLVGSGLFSKVPQTLYQVNDFRIDYNADESISQFYSEISVYDSKNKLVKSELINVNKPLKYENIVIYQTDWNINGLRVRINDQNFQILARQLLTETKQKIWVCSIPDIGENQSQINLIVNSLNNQVSIYDDTGKLISNIQIYDNFIIDNNIIQILEVLSSSGLQIKVDPGIVVVYIGFFALMISSIISYISFDEIWITKQSEKLASTGRTNRSVLEFENHFSKLIRKSISKKSQSII
uniref:c-type cytochrome biogenensis protein n=1 Tax=Erythrolobus coxiae TaxID=362235 RepID=UPI001FCD29B7|nr:c-type cytochrome biogenensis protein [Erythrolobus coxiae]UNJ17710.1 c-type cytochrome biogenensis protein [Erythrolobus coxiae]